MRDQSNSCHLISSLEALLSAVQGHRQLGHSIVFTNGCFDLLHVGHVRCLAEAAQQGDVLVVGLNSDASVRRIKGVNRPVVIQENRGEILAALRVVDYVSIFEEDTPVRLIEAIRPDVLVKGADYQASEVVGASFVLSYGGRVHRVPLTDGISTTATLQRLQGSAESHSP